MEILGQNPDNEAANDDGARLVKARDSGFDVALSHRLSIYLSIE